MAVSEIFPRARHQMGRLACVLCGVGLLSLSGVSPLTEDAAAQESIPVENVLSTDPLDVQLLLGTGEQGLDQWEYFSGKKGAALAETWSLQADPDSGSPMIVCRGEPFGYLKTRRKFRNFEFGLEWRFPKDVNGNSGVLLHTSGEDRIWPTSLQVQLHQQDVGATFPSGGAKADNELRNLPPHLSKPLQQWNQCQVTCRNGTVRVSINGQLVGEVTGCDPHVGAIGLQSEGSEIHFRGIWIRELPAEEIQQVSQSEVTPAVP